MRTFLNALPLPRRIFCLNFLLFGAVNESAGNREKSLRLSSAGSQRRSSSQPSEDWWSEHTEEGSGHVLSPHPLIMLLWRRILAIRAWRIGRGLGLAPRCWSGKDSRILSSRVSRNRYQTRFKHRNATPRKFCIFNLQRKIMSKKLKALNYNF